MQSSYVNQRYFEQFTNKKSIVFSSEPLNRLLLKYPLTQFSTDLLHNKLLTSLNRDGLSVKIASLDDANENPIPF